jgi:hypothetical protein
MVSSSQNGPATGSFSMFRDPTGGDPSSPFEDDPSLGESHPVGGASSQNLGAVEDVDEEVEEEDIEDDGLEDGDDEFDEDEDDEFDDEEDEAEEAGLGPALLAQDDGEADDDSGDDGRENAVDEDKLNAEEEDDLSGDDSSLSIGEARTMRRGLATAPTTFSQAEMNAIL